MGALSGKAAVVTGGASGIGLATATRLAAEGASVVVVDQNSSAGEKVAADLGGRFVPADVGDPSAWAPVISAAEEAFGGIDVAYLNAGVTTGEGDITLLTDEQYRRILGANIGGVVLGVRAVVPAIERRGGGAIVATASVAGLISLPMDPIYAMTKHAVVGLVRSLAPQLSVKGITINAICPGVVDTPLLGEGVGLMLKQSGMPLIDPAQIAEAVLGRVLGTETGQAWTCQWDRPVHAYEWNPVPGLEGGLFP